MPGIISRGEEQCEWKQTKGNQLNKKSGTFSSTALSFSAYCQTEPVEGCLLDLEHLFQFTDRIQFFPWEKFHRHFFLVLFSFVEDLGHGL